MEPRFWHERWHAGRIGFHQERVTPLLEQYWPTLALARGSRVFVPLAGKSLDMPWLLAQGHRVLGVELSRIAVEQFFDEQSLRPATHESGLGTHFIAGDIELICGDAFALDAATLADCTGVYDRAALIALPADMRERYVRNLQARLPGGCRGLLVTLDYPQQEKAGPPFSVQAEEVQALYDRDWQVECLERRDILAAQPAFVAEGVTRLHTSAYRIEKRF
jgi:thiopurine S-methyltransferase